MIHMTCHLAIQHGLAYAWIDICCIDKTSSAELSGVMYSMFRWCQKLRVCFVYLRDLEPNCRDHPGQCRWYVSKPVDVLSGRWCVLGSPVAGLCSNLSLLHECSILIWCGGLISRAVQKQKCKGNDYIQHLENEPSNFRHMRSSEEFIGYWQLGLPNSMDFGVVNNAQ